MLVLLRFVADIAPENVAPERFAFAFNAVCVAVETGLFTSLVLSTLLRDRSDFKVATVISSGSPVPAVVRPL